MTNFEHMSEEEKKKALINGMYITSDGECKICPQTCCFGCKDVYKTECRGYLDNEEMAKWLDEEYIEPKTENEKFCETLRTGEIIVVWNEGKLPVLRTFIFYDKKTDSIQCVNNGHLIFSNEDELGRFSHGRKLTAEERGE